MRIKAGILYRLAESGQAKLTDPAWPAQIRYVPVAQVDNVLCCRTGTSVVVVDDDIDAGKLRIAGPARTTGMVSAAAWMPSDSVVVPTTTSPSIPCRSIAPTESLPMRRPGIA